MQTGILTPEPAHIPAGKADRPGSRLELVGKALCLPYLGVLCWLLLTTGPRSLLQSGFLGFLPWYDILVVGHFLLFTLLSVLAFLSRWRIPSWAVLLMLVVAAVGTELLQSWVPTRTPDMADCLQNLAGIGLGGGLYWTAAWLLRPETLRYTG